MLAVNVARPLPRVGNFLTSFRTGYQSAQLNLTWGLEPVFSFFLALIRCEFPVLCCPALSTKYDFTKDGSENPTA